MAKNDDFGITQDGDIIDEKALILKEIHRAYIDGQKLILTNMKKFIERDINYIEPKDSKFSQDNTKILEGIKIAYFKITFLINQSLEDIEVEGILNDPLTKKGES